MHGCNDVITCGVHGCNDVSINGRGSSLLVERLLTRLIWLSAVDPVIRRMMVVVMVVKPTYAPSRSLRVRLNDILYIYV